MPVTPSGPLSLPLDYLRQTVAGSATFQAWTGTVGQTAALARVFLEQAPTGSTLPFAVVGGPLTIERERNVDSGDTRLETPRGTLALMFRCGVSQSDPGDALQDFQNNVGGIVDDMGSLSGKAGYLDITGFKLRTPAARPEQDERIALGGDFYELELEVEFRTLW